MKTELNKCPQCGQVLARQAEVHAVRGELFCSEKCAINYIMEDHINNAKELAKAEYMEEAEVISTEDVLKEDLHEVRIISTFVSYVRLPADMSEDDALDMAESMYKDGLIDLADCDSSEATYELVKNDNSECEE